MLELCVQSGGAVDKHGVEKGFEILGKAGFEAVDFNIDQLFTWGEIVSGNEPEKFRDDYLIPYMTRVKSAAEKNGIKFGQFHAPFPSYVRGCAEANKNVLNAVIRSIEMCDFCGCPRIVVHPCSWGGPSDPMPKSEEHEVNIRFYTALIPHLKKHHVICCLENMFCYDNVHRKVYQAVCSQLDETVRYIDELNGIAGERLFGFCLDTGHLLLLGADVYEWIVTLGGRLETLHIHDNNGTNDDHIGPYMGAMDWERVCRGLREAGYRNPLSFETYNINNRYPPELHEPLYALLRATAAYFRERILA